MGHARAMSLHPVLAEKLSAAMAAEAPLALTRRDARLSAVPGKVHAVIGMRRAGKTTFLRQLLQERRAKLPAERAIYLSFDDDQLAGLGADQLGFLLEEYYRRVPALRGRETVHWFLDEIQLVTGWERFVRHREGRDRCFRVIGADALARGSYVAARPRNGDRYPTLQLPRVSASPGRGAGRGPPALETGRAIADRETFSRILRISAIADADFSVIVDGVSP